MFGKCKSVIALSADNVSLPTSTKRFMQVFQGIVDFHVVQSIHDRETQKKIF